MASIQPEIWYPQGPAQASWGYVPLGPSYTNAGAAALFKNESPVFAPSTTATTSYSFAPLDFLGPLSTPISWFFGCANPLDRTNFQPGDIFVNTFNQFYPVGNGQNPQLWQFQETGLFTPIGNLLQSALAQQSNAVVVNGGTDSTIQTALNTVGRDGQLVLSGAFTCSNWVRNLTGNSVTLIFSSATLNFGQAASGAVIGQTVRKNGTLNRLVPSPSNFQTTIEQNSLS